MVISSSVLLIPRNAPAIAIGRPSISSFSKIILEPVGLQRTFNSKTLGHVYLSDLAPPQLQTLLLPLFGRLYKQWFRVRKAEVPRLGSGSDHAGVLQKLGSGATSSLDCLTH